MDIQAEFDKLGPWTTKYIIDGKEYGGNIDLLTDTALQFFRQEFPSARYILELGGFEGCHTFNLASTYENVLSLEGRDYNIKKAKFIQNLFGVTNVRFDEANFEKDNLSQFGHFDAVFCVGVLYHMPNPWFILEQISSVTDNVLIWTQYISEKRARDVHSYRGKFVHEYGFEDSLSGLSKKSLWLTIDSINRILSEVGFSKIKVLEKRKIKAGRCITISASKS